MFNLKQIIVLLTINNIFVNCFEFSEQCGHSTLRTGSDWRVIGGRDAERGEFPWQIILGPFDHCSGTIINERWILTAGHCANNGAEKQTKVRLGVYNMTLKENTERDVSVEKIIRHPNFLIEGQELIYDLTLIKLNEALNFTGTDKNLSPICLAESNTNLTKNCVASGFGFINTHRQRPIDGILQKLETPYADPNVCRKIFQHYNETQQICAGGLPTGGHAVCNGDSGGPLQCQSMDGRWFQVGIVSNGKPCALPNDPDIYTRVSAFIDWIKHTIANN